MPLTEEESKKKKADKKAQKLKAVEEMKIKIRKDELSREVANAKDTFSSHIKTWYQSNYVARFPHIKQDMEVARQFLEHTLDVKDFVIVELTNRMDESRLQESMSWQDYALRIDDLIKGFQSHLEDLDGEHHKDVKRLVERAWNAQEEQAGTQQNLEDYYKTVLMLMEQNFNDATSLSQGEYMTKRDEEAKKGVHSIEVMSGALEGSLRTTAGLIKDTLLEYRDSTEARRKEVEQLRLRDEYYSNMIKRQDIRMSKLCDDLAALQSQVGANHESRLVLEDLRHDKEETFSEYAEVRAQLTRDAATDHSRILTLTTESNNGLHDLQRILVKGEKILRLASLCRKLETQEEKVLPFGIPIDQEDHLIVKQGHSPFNLFWRRYANADLIKRKLEPTLMNLQQENQQLRDNIQTALEIMAMTQP